MFRTLAEFRNPDTFFGRFVAQFALAFSACLVATAITFLLGRGDLLMAGIWSLGFSTLLGLIRAKLSGPGASFWGSSFAKSPPSS
ncbi:MAG: hypothetical protein IPL43_15035 [Micropruina sp.]|nr:hypothetical protein [Micropruina sp.]